MATGKNNITQYIHLYVHTYIHTIHTCRSSKLGGLTSECVSNIITGYVIKVEVLTINLRTYMHAYIHTHRRRFDWTIEEDDKTDLWR